MRKFSKLFSIIIAVSMIVCALCINVMAAYDYNSLNHTLGGISFETEGELTVYSTHAKGKTTVTRKAGGSTQVTVNMYANIIADYTTGSIGYGSASTTNVVYQSLDQSNNCEATYYFDTSRTLNYVACEHYSVNANNLSDTGAVGTYIDFSSPSSDANTVLTVVLPGIDF